ncbi:CHRD domain-containing protein [Rufibacter psychrotolerans]|uniref:CHRD domain-containing protein n=1 Tax=Rufibacter psychrotolerans TaxID=2812556 RepID=UPI0019678CDB|nr:CHRD domain-containing protein [Rufibacter sp. SYSU D00308]
MKTKTVFFRLALGLLFVLPFALVSCGDDDEDTQPTNLVQFQNTTLTGAKEVPANNSTATGTFSGTYNQDTKILTYTITWTGLTATNMHFHKGEVGSPGPVVIPIGSAPYTSPINAQTPPLTQDQEADLLAGRWFVNIHSAAFQGGEIRGQVVRQ